MEYLFFARVVYLTIGVLMLLLCLNLFLILKTSFLLKRLFFLEHEMLFLWFLGLYGDASFFVFFIKIIGLCESWG